jgi:hypothetical protein
MADDKPIKVPFRVSPDLHRAVSRKLADEPDGTRKWQSLLQGLVEQWLGGDLTPSRPDARLVLSDRDQDLVNKLIEVLKSGQTDAIKAVKENILVFHRYTKLQYTLAPYCYAS